MLTRYLIHRRDTAAYAWLSELRQLDDSHSTSRTERRAHRRLTRWDTLLALTLKE